MTEKTPIDWAKPLRTSVADGKITIYCTDAPGEFCVHGRIEFTNGTVVVAKWTMQGVHYCVNEYNIINAPEELEVWVNIFIDPKGGYSTNGGYLVDVCASKEVAKNNAARSKNIIGRRKLTIADLRRFDE